MKFDIKNINQTQKCKHKDFKVFKHRLKMIKATQIWNKNLIRIKFKYFVSKVCNART